MLVYSECRPFSTTRASRAWDTFHPSFCRYATAARPAPEAAEVDAVNRAASRMEPWCRAQYGPVSGSQSNEPEPGPWEMPLMWAWAGPRSARGMSSGRISSGNGLPRMSAPPRVTWRRYRPFAVTRYEIRKMLSPASGCERVVLPAGPPSESRTSAARGTGPLQMLPRASQTAT